MNTMNTHSTHVIQVSQNQTQISCPPKDIPHWNQHPRVYLPIFKDQTTTCPYCGQMFRITNPQ